MLSWLPVLGPILQSILSSATSIYGKFKDTELGKAQVEGQVRQTEVNASVQLTTAFKDDTSLKVMRDLLIAPIVIWSALGYWDKIIEHTHPEWVVQIHAFPDGSPLAYLPFAVFIFLFGNLWLNKK